VPKTDPATPVVDHRPKVALKKRQVMRGKLLDAAMRVFAVSGVTAPVIDDVIREANVSRGTFYNYFNSLDEVLVAIGQELNNQMTTDILPVYDVLTQPCQRVAVAFRLFLLRALLDPQWAGFVTRVEAWQHTTLVAEYMARDLENGKAAGDFEFDQIEAATDFLMGASAHGIQAIRQGVELPSRYMDTCVRMTLASLGCHADKCQEANDFSISYLQSWASNELTATSPAWAVNMDSDHARHFMTDRK
jgi:AcrR family transcriptional regulator